MVGWNELDRRASILRRPTVWDASGRGTAAFDEITGDHDAFRLVPEPTDVMMIGRAKQACAPERRRSHNEGRSMVGCERSALRRVRLPQIVIPSAFPCFQCAIGTHQHESRLSIMDDTNSTQRRRACRDRLFVSLRRPIPRSVATILVFAAEAEKVGKRMRFDSHFANGCLTRIKACWLSGGSRPRTC